MTCYEKKLFALFCLLQARILLAADESLRWKPGDTAGRTSGISAGTEKGENILAEYDKTVTALLEEFDAIDDKEYKNHIIYTLGNLREVQAIPLLLNLLITAEEYKVSPSMRCSTADWAIGALAKIGIPSVKPIQKLMNTTDDEALQYNLMFSLQALDGYHLALFFSGIRTAESP